MKSFHREKIFFRVYLKINYTFKSLGKSEEKSKKMMVIKIGSKLLSILDNFVKLVIQNLTHLKKRAGLHQRRSNVHHFLHSK